MQGSTAEDPSCTSLLSLPPVLLQLIVAYAGREGRGAACACRALQRAFSDALALPLTAACFCLSTWGRGAAVRGGLMDAQGLLQSFPLEEREAQLRRVLRAVVQAGGSLRHDTQSIIVAALKTGYSGVLAEVLALLSVTPSSA